MKTFRFQVAGERVAVNLFSLAEYEAEGGIYDDTGNGGERFEPNERGQFVCAAAVQHNDTGLTDNDVLVASGADDFWLDSVTDFFLLRDWPTEAPYEARFLN